MRRDAWVTVATVPARRPGDEDGDVHRPHRPSIASAPSRASTSSLHLYSVSLKHRIRLYGGVPENDPTIDTLCPVWAGANWFEREAYDLYGVRFKGHPDLRRILMYPEFVGHPLRKDYPKEKRQPLVRRSQTDGGRLDEHTTAHARADDPPRRPRLPGRRGLSGAPDLPTEPVPLNMGPSHPAMHGTVRMVLEVEGETISSADIQIGYLHRCFEKESENATWTQIFPYTDRLNYISPMLNNVGYAMAVEKLLGIDKKIPERAQFIRVIVGEVSRISDHLTCLGASAMELGAFTVFLYALKAREWLFELLEEVCGARLTSTLLPHRRPRLRPARRLRRQAARHPRAHARGDVGHRQAAGAQPHLPRPHGRHRHHHQGRRAGVRHHRARSGARPASPTTCARTTRTWSTTASTSTSRSARWATTSTVTPCASRRCMQSMRILDQALEKIPAGPVDDRTIRASRCRPRARPTTRSRR